MKRAVPLGVRRIYQRDHAFQFLMEMQMEYSFEKNVSVFSN